MFGELTSDEMDQFMKSQFLGRLGCYADKKVYVVPVSYAYDGDSIYCHSNEGMKTAMMRKNPSVCFQVDQQENMATWKSVIAWGEYREIEDGAEREKALKILLGRLYPFVSSQRMQLGKDWPFTPDDLNEIPGIVFKIVLTERTGRYEMVEKPWYYNEK